MAFSEYLVFWVVSKSNKNIQYSVTGRQFLLQGFHIAQVSGIFILFTVLSGPFVTLVIFTRNKIATHPVNSLTLTRVFLLVPDCFYDYQNKSGLWSVCCIPHTLFESRQIHTADSPCSHYMPDHKYVLHHSYIPYYMPCRRIFLSWHLSSLWSRDNADCNHHIAG